MRRVRRERIPCQSLRLPSHRPQTRAQRRLHHEALADNRNAADKAASASWAESGEGTRLLRLRRA